MENVIQILVVINIPIAQFVQKEQFSKIIHVLIVVLDTTRLRQTPHLVQHVQLEHIRAIPVRVIVMSVQLEDIEVHREHLHA